MKSSDGEGWRMGAWDNARWWRLRWGHIGREIRKYPAAMKGL